MAEKNKIRSIRFTEELYELIDRQYGDTFTQKLENLVTKCVWELPAKEAELARIKEAIATEQKNLIQLRQTKQKITTNINEANRALDNLQWQVNRVVSALESIDV